MRRRHLINAHYVTRNTSRGPTEDGYKSMALIVISVLSLIWPSLGGLGRPFELIPVAEAVSVQRLQVPDLVVIDQLNLVGPARPALSGADYMSRPLPNPSGANYNQQQQQRQPNQQITFECLISFDKRKDKNLIVKWHHEERNEPIYQWIPELNKRSIAPQYRPYIVPLLADSMSLAEGALMVGGQNVSAVSSTSSNPSQIQLLEAGFRLVRPHKELGGEYTCSAISSQNDDSKSKKMIVYTPPRSFRLNVSRTDIGALLASQRDRLIQLTQPASMGPRTGYSPSSVASQADKLPLAYRMRGFGEPASLQQQQLHFGPPTTISPQMYSTIDYVNVNPQRARQLSGGGWQTSRSQLQPVAPTGGGFDSVSGHLNRAQARQTASKQNGVRLVCDIDQVFPVPEVSIYRLAKHQPGSQPDKLAKLDTKIERDVLTGLFNVQVISILDDDELQMKYGHNEPVYFECLIALTNLELGKYADNRRSVVYRPGIVSSQMLQKGDDIRLDQVGSSAQASATLNLLPTNKLDPMTIFLGLLQLIVAVLFSYRSQMSRAVLIPT